MKFYLIPLFTILAFLTFAQSRNATVVGVINLGSIDYSLIQENGTSNIFKTSPYPTQSLGEGQDVEIMNTQNEGQVKVLAETLSETVYAQKVENNEGFLPPSEIKPSLEYDILFFENEQEAKEYYEWLEIYLDQNTGDVDSLLDILEDSFSGYVSFRTFFNNKYDFENGEFTDEQLEDISREDFLSDIILKTLLNEYRLVGIGEEITYFHEDNQWVKFAKGDVDALSTIKLVENGADLFDPNSGVIQNNKFNIQAPLIVYSGESKGQYIVNSQKKFTSTPKIENVNCSIYKKRLRVVVSVCNWDQTNSEWDCEQLNYTQYPSNTTLTINWGDGSTVETIDEYDGTFIDHEYPATGTYYPTTQLTFGTSVGLNWYVVSLNDGQGTSGSDITMQVASSCQESEYHKLGYDFSGSWKMESKLWYKVNSFGTHIGGFTHAWKKQSNGNWKREKAEIYIYVNGDFRNDDCVIVKTEIGSKLHHNDKKIEKTKSTFITDYDMYNGDVHSTHYLKKGSTYIARILVLNPCN